MGMENKFGVLKFSSYNIGDEIQSVAAMQFLPQVDYYIHREDIDKFRSEGDKVKLIMNAWWMWRPDHFPPSKDIEPLLISMHISETIRNRFLENGVKEYLIQNGPVGCRDLGTLQYLQENNVPAYFSGCLTLTLQGNKEMKQNRKDYILCIDTPVLFLSLKNMNKGRFGGLSSLLHESSDEEFIRNKEIYNVDNPPANPQKYCELRDNLIQRCSDFTGYYSPHSIFEDDFEPLIMLIKLLKYDRDNIKRTLWFAERDDLLDILYAKQIKRTSKHDLKY